MLSLLYLFLFCLAGALAGFIGHIIRATVNLYPDKISDNELVNIIVSPDYSTSDSVFNLEFDDFGFYKLYSIKNVQFCLACGFATGFFAYVVAPEPQTSELIAQIFSGFGELVADRWENLRLI